MGYCDVGRCDWIASGSVFGAKFGLLAGGVADTCVVINDYCRYCDDVRVLRHSGRTDAAEVRNESVTQTLRLRDYCWPLLV